VYIREGGRDLFRTKDAKIKALKERIEAIRAHGGGDYEVMKKISVALEE
jgi:hypothetical protein